jgi:hypothetical protein
LEPGEVPEWYPHDIVDEEKMGGVNSLLSDINDFIKIIHEHVKIY